MKNNYIAIILFISLQISCLSAFAQFKDTDTSAIWQIAYNETFRDNLNYNKRYSDQIAVIKENGKSDSVSSKEIDVLFVGSSSFRGWRTVYQDMAPLNVVNNGFGGATIRDILYHYDIVVKPFKFKKVVLYVENDVSPSQTIKQYVIFDLFRTFASKIAADYPDATLYIVSLKPSVKRADMLERQTALNSMLKDYADNMPKVEYIDIVSKMMTPQGVDPTLFIGDKLHMNEKGYRLWTEIIKPYLIK